jgi:CheY-like chemotaxis protein
MWSGLFHIAILCSTSNCFMHCSTWLLEHKTHSPPCAWVTVVHRDLAIGTPAAVHVVEKLAMVERQARRSEKSISNNMIRNMSIDLAEIEKSFSRVCSWNSEGRKQILVVDDAPIILRAVRMALTLYGYAVETASSGAQALDKLSTGIFDLVITDFNMPGMNGTVLAKEIKGRHPGLPIILLTACLRPVPSADVDIVLAKPYSNSTLRSAIVSLTSSSVASDHTASAA